VRWIK